MALTTQEFESPDTAARAAQVASGDDLLGEKMVLNMGPSHPATHGVLRIVLELDGEIITKADAGRRLSASRRRKNRREHDIHPVHPLHGSAGLSRAAGEQRRLRARGGKTDGHPRQIAAALPIHPRDLLRTGAHFLAFARARRVRDGRRRGDGVSATRSPSAKKFTILCEALTGARFTTSYTRIGGLTRDLPPGWSSNAANFSKEVVVNIDEVGNLAHAQSHLGGPHARCRRDFKGGCDRLRLERPESARQRRRITICARSSRISVTKIWNSTFRSARVGDCYDRYLVRMEEMRQSVRILHQCLDKIPGGAETNRSRSTATKSFAADEKSADEHGGIDPSIHLVTEGVNVPPGEIYFGAENPKGELGFYINSKGGGTPHRLKIRAPSFVQPEHPARDFCPAT